MGNISTRDIYVDTEVDIDIHKTSLSISASISIWAVAKIMVPFWIPYIVGAVLY